MPNGDDWDVGLVARADSQNPLRPPGINIQLERRVCHDE
jgi:hypothetical protein